VVDVYLYHALSVVGAVKHVHVDAGDLTKKIISNYRTVMSNRNSFQTLLFVREDLSKRIILAVSFPYKHSATR